MIMQLWHHDVNGGTGNSGANIPGHATESTAYSNVIYALGVTTVWAAAQQQFWKRRQAALAFNWGTQDLEATEPPRPEFAAAYRRHIA